MQVPTLILKTPTEATISSRAKDVASLMGAELKVIPGEPVGCGHTAAREKLRRFIGVERTPTELDAILSTVMFTDIVDSTQKQASLGDADGSAHRAVTSLFGTPRTLAGHGDDTAGDSFYASFDGPARSDGCAQDACARVADIGMRFAQGCTRVGATR